MMTPFNYMNTICTADEKQFIYLVKLTVKKKSEKKKKAKKNYYSTTSKQIVKKVNLMRGWGGRDPQQTLHNTVN